MRFNLFRSSISCFSLIGKSEFSFEVRYIPLRIQIYRHRPLPSARLRVLLQVLVGLFFRVLFLIFGIPIFVGHHFFDVDLPYYFHVRLHLRHSRNVGYIQHLFPELLVPALGRIYLVQAIRKSLGGSTSF